MNVRIALVVSHREAGVPRVVRRLRRRRRRRVADDERYTYVHHVTESEIAEIFYEKSIPEDVKAELYWIVLRRYNNVMSDEDNVEENPVEVALQFHLQGDGSRHHHRYRDNRNTIVERL